MPEAVKPLFALLMTLGLLGFLLPNAKSTANFGLGGLSAPRTVAVQTPTTEPPQTTDVPQTTTTVASGVSLSAESAAAAERVSRALFDGINRERRYRNEPELVWDDTLAAQARQWSSRLAGQNKLEHRSISGGASSVEPGLSVYGENIYRSKIGVPALSIHDAWMQSDEHRQNTLQTGFDRVGVGVFCSADGSVWATQAFGGGNDTDLTSDVPPADPLAWSTGDGPGCK